MTQDRRGAGWKKLRQFQQVRRADGSGKLVYYAQITCSSCSSTALHLRRGTLDDANFFTQKGWDVGNNGAHDFCPNCIAAAKGKVIKMADHKTTAEPVLATLSREDGRLLSRAIEDRWDEAHKTYTTGWSDAKLGEEMGVPVDWVKTIRERDFGGTGEDPGMMAFMTEQVSIRVGMGDLARQLEASSALHNGITEEIADLGRKLDGYKRAHGRMFEQVQKLDDLAKHLDKMTGGKMGLLVNKKVG